MRFNDQALLPSSAGLVRSALAGQSSALSPLASSGTMGPWEAANEQKVHLKPFPVCTQLGLGTVELLNWRKIALYLGLSAKVHPCPLRYMLGLN